MENTDLELIYFSKDNCLHFDSNDVQDIIINAIDISMVTHFATMDLETGKYIPSDHLLCNDATFNDLIYISENDLRYMGYSAEFKNGIKLRTDINLTFFFAPSTESLFDLSSFIFEAYGLVRIEWQHELLRNPDQWMMFTNDNGEMRLITDIEEIKLRKYPFRGQEDAPF
ncbi:MAG: hypothetical protein ACOH2V_13540 [Candidatus Saccharimonadaceae bacterium]